MPRYKCLVLDHDDTVVRSTPAVNYPAFVHSLKLLRPEMDISLEQFLLYNYEPGLQAFCHELLGYDDTEMQVQHDCWREFSDRGAPDAYEGFDRLLPRFREQGGVICVVTHSSSDYVVRDYTRCFGLAPDLVFDWDLPPEQRKPEPWPLEEIMRRYSLRPSDLLVVDDLKPGCDMAHRCGVAFAYAGWSLTVPRLHELMTGVGEYSFKSVDEMADLLLD